LELSEVR